ncbi:DUF3783 domain-containing protein [Clostridium hydrogenum]|uniref:DUF3783 domain-containing protein n=1 Tax=Clostridium hydrogenum TaxID=2855764 RepID=UPI001F3AAB7A|nr:DUF3783 domain-containing protein [Clostridium hydrogenum]
MENKSQVLIYGFTNDEISQIKETFNESKIPSILTLSESMAKMKINDIMEGKENLTDDTKLPDEKLVLFNNVSDKKIEKVIPAVIKISNKKPIFAVVTPVSINWSLKYLIEHMIDERSWYLKNNKK